MRTKMPADLKAGDRLVARYGRHVVTLEAEAFAYDGGHLHVRFTDDTTVTITDLDVPVEVAS